MISSNNMDQDYRLELIARGEDIFSVDHSQAVLTIKGSLHGAIGVVVPPFVMYYPPSLFKFGSPAVSFLYHEWHERKHLGQLNYTSLGQYSVFLMNLSADLIRFALYAPTQEDKEACLKLGIELSDKSNTIRNMGRDVLEGWPCFCQIDPTGRAHLVNVLMNSLRSKHQLKRLRSLFGTSEISRKELSKEVDFWANQFSKEFEEGKPRKKEREPHVNGYQLCKRVFEKYENIGSVFYATTVALSIDLHDINLLTIPVKDLEKELREEKPELRNPTFRLESMIGKKDENLRDRSNSEVKAKTDSLSSELAYFKDGLRRSYIESVRALPSTHSPIFPFDRHRYRFQWVSANKSGERPRGSPVHHAQNKYGMLTIPLIPPVISTKFEEDIQEFLSIEAAHDLILMTAQDNDPGSGIWVKFPLKMLACMLYELGRLENIVKNGQLYHDIAMLEFAKVVNRSMSVGGVVNEKLRAIISELDELRKDQPSRSSSTV